MFIDECEIHVKAGRGGDGSVAFLREKYRPWGGPAGGDGGKGGDITFEAGYQVDTLLYLYRKKHIQAPKGLQGSNKNCSGRSGKNVFVPVPCGTIIFEQPGGTQLADLAQPGDRFVVLGGRGGRGNQHFATSTHQTPREFERGQDGEERELRLELKLIADAGLIGLPNAGKSTLLSRISAARPKIAPYPFTTREPHLGIVSAGDYTQVVVADLPGLIEGAHAGVGLGDEFLRHVERTAFLIHLVDAAPPDGSDPVENFKKIENELKLYSAALHERPRLIVANKLDVDGASANLQRMKKKLKCEIFGISAMTGVGLKELVGALVTRVSNKKSIAGSAW